MCFTTDESTCFILSQRNSSNYVFTSVETMQHFCFVITYHHIMVCIQLLCLKNFHSFCFPQKHPEQSKSINCLKLFPKWTACRVGINSNSNARVQFPALMKIIDSFRLDNDSQGLKVIILNISGLCPPWRGTMPEEHYSIKPRICIHRWELLVYIFKNSLLLIQATSGF